MTLLKKTILIIDDDKDYTDLMTTWLKEVDCRALVFNDSVKALRSLEDSKPDLVLLDLKMPDVSGHDICGVLKHHESLAEVPVFYLSAIESEKEKKKALSLGAKEYLVKKIGKKSLLEKITQQLK